MRRDFPGTVTIFQGTVGGEIPPTNDIAFEETFLMPSIGSFRTLLHQPVVAGTFKLTRVSDGFTYTAGTDYSLNETLGRVTNLAITPNTNVRAAYWYRAGSGGSGSMSAAAILTALLGVDGPGSQLNADFLDGLDATAFALVSHNHDTLYVKLTDVGVTIANLVGGKLPTAYLPSLAINTTHTVASQAEMLALADVDRGDVAIRTDLGATFILAADDQSILANWVRLPTAVDAVISVNGQTGVVVLDAHDVGAYLQSEVYNKAQIDAKFLQVDENSGFHYATLVKYGL